jgi:pimeloyl-ACP methyl ester carboxylesterase
MGNLKIGWLAAGALAIVIVVVALLVYARYRRDMRAAQERLQSGGSQVIYPAGYPLEEITVPVLIISAVDDPLTLYVNAQGMAERIPGAKLVTIESGGHMLLGHEERIRSEIVTFLAGIDE